MQNKTNNSSPKRIHIDLITLLEALEKKNKWSGVTASEEVAHNPNILKPFLCLLKW